jgi:hypothetical protein
MQMTELLEYLNKNSGAFTVIFTAVVTVATAVYALLTYVLVKETRLMRQVQTEPKIEITVRSLEIAIHIVRLHIRNIGLGPAMQVKFSPRVVAGGESAEKLMVEFTETNFFKAGLAYFGPGQEHFSNYTQMTQGLEGKIVSVIAFDLEYESVTGKLYRESVIIDMSEQKGAYQLGKPHLYSIAQSLESLQKDVGHVVSGFKRIRTDVFTSEDRDAENEAWQKYKEEIAKDASA